MSDACSCLGTLDAFNISYGTKLNVSIGGNTFSYSAGYGQWCSAHDMYLPPACIVSSSICAADDPSIAVGIVTSECSKLEAWCYLPWCYVNMTRCAASYRSGYVLQGLADPSGVLGYSYAACGACDLYNVTAPDAADDCPACDDWVVATIIGSACGAALVVVLLALYLVRRRKRLLASYYKHRLYWWADDALAEAVPLPEELTFHLFLSHSWLTGQDQMRVVKDRLAAMVPSLTVFLDVDDLTEGRGSEFVDRSMHVLCFFTDGYFRSANCMRELLRAVFTGKPLIALLDPAKGGLSWDEIPSRLETAFTFLDEWQLTSELAQWKAERPGHALPTPKSCEEALSARPYLEWSRIRAFHDVTCRWLAEPLLAPNTSATFHLNRGLKHTVRRFSSYNRRRSSDTLPLEQQRDPTRDTTSTLGRQSFVAGEGAAVTGLSLVGAPPSSIAAIAEVSAASAHADSSAAALANSSCHSSATRSSDLLHASLKAAATASLAVTPACAADNPAAEPPATAPPDAADQSCSSTLAQGPRRITVTQLRNVVNLTMSLRSLRRSSDGAGSVAQAYFRPLTYLKSEFTRRKIVVPPPRGAKSFHIYCSPNNLGSAELITELHQRCKIQLQVTSDKRFLKLKEVESFLVYLNGNTWTHGEASEAFATEVSLAMRHGIHLLLAHEEPGFGDAARAGCPFERFFSCENGETPRRLVLDGIYQEIAVPLKGGVLRDTSMAMLAFVFTQVRNAKYSPLHKLSRAVTQPSSTIFHLTESHRDDDGDDSRHTGRARYSASGEPRLRRSSYAAPEASDSGHHQSAVLSALGVPHAHPGFGGATRVTVRPTDIQVLAPSPRSPNAAEVQVRVRRGRSREAAGSAAGSPNALRWLRSQRDSARNSSGSTKRHSSGGHLSIADGVAPSAPANASAAAAAAAAATASAEPMRLDPSSSATTKATRPSDAKTSKPVVPAAMEVLVAEESFSQPKSESGGFFGGVFHFLEGFGKNFSRSPTTPPTAKPPLSAARTPTTEAKT